MSYDKHIYKRRVNTVGDRLSNIGGLFGALTPLFYALVNIFNFKGQYLYLMRELFVEPLKHIDDKKGAKFS